MKILVALLVASVASPLGANATGDGSSGTLDVNANVRTGYQFGRQYCPPESPATTAECVRFLGAIGIPGLGRATFSYVKSFDETICPGRVVQQKTTVVDVARKGQIKVAMDYPVCANTAPASVVIKGTIVEGTGTFAGASGSLQLASTVNIGSGRDTWTGTLTVTGLDFDLTPPVLRPLASKRVEAQKRAKTVRVRYSPKAQDVVDGPVPVTCKPRSGSRFKVGRTTRVSCSAEDTSANIATASFKIKVARKSR